MGTGAPRSVAARLHRNAYLIMVLATLMWAGNAVAGRLVIGQASPMVVTCLRWVLVMAVLGVVNGRAVMAEWHALAPRWLYLLAMGGLGFTAFNALFYEAAHRTSAVNLGVIQGIMPALVLVGSFVAYRTPIRALQIAGLGLTLAGVLVTTCRGDLDVLRTMDFNVGDILMLIASVLYSGYAVALRERPPVPPIVFFTALACTAFLTSLPLLGFEIARGVVLWPSAKGWLIILFIATCPSLLAQLFFLRGIELIGAGRAGLFINLVPVFAALLGVSILGETFAPYHAIALVLVIGGIWLAERAR